MDTFGTTRTHRIAARMCLFIAFVLGGCTVPPPGIANTDGTTLDAPAIDTLSLLREAADHEALFTLAGGLKPMSSGIWRGTFLVDDPDLSEVREVRAALAPLRNDVWYADVQVYDEPYDGERFADAYVVHRAALAGMIERYESFWSPWGITPDTHPAEVVAVVDRMPKADRWRGYGYLFGYPADAVDFFVEAGIAADQGGDVGPGKDRRFIHIRTYAEAQGRFTYAVPLEHVLTDADKALADQARWILEAYTQRRTRMTDVRNALTELRRLNERFDAAVVVDGASR
ncbi:MAG: hypothetical protein AAGD32_08130 [Planctomycetota bacterium]